MLVARLALQFDPVDIVETVREQIVEIAVEIPMLELGAIEQQHRRRDIVRLTVVARARHRPDRLVAEVAAEQLGDVADAEAIRVGDDRAPL